MSASRLAAAALLALAGLQAAAAEAPRAPVAAPAANEQRVRDFVAAFNRQDIDGMLARVTDDIQWLSVAGDAVKAETRGKDALRDSLLGYFSSTRGARSELEWVRGTASRVAALERAHWLGKSGPRSQASLSVYEFDGERIARVYYYPAEK